MIFNNIEFHNVAELTKDPDGYYIMHRFPLSVEENMEVGQNANKVSTGVELRFKLKSPTVKIKLKSETPDTLTTAFYLYRGSIIGKWDEYVKYIRGGEIKEFVINKHPEPGLLKEITKAHGYPFSEEVIRLVFNHSSIKFVGIDGELEPPSESEKPTLKYLAYGSSITHGSQSVGTPTSFVSRIASYFNADAFNKGLAGSARLESAVADEIAMMGKRGEWDFATLCLGINVANLDPDIFRSRVRYMLSTVTANNPEKPVFAISPIYSKDDMLGKTNLKVFRRVIGEEVERISSENLHYINGLELMGGAEGLSADLVHPSQDGVDGIAKRLIERINPYVKNK